MLMEHMFGEGAAVCELLLEKVIMYYRSDDLAEVIEDIFTTASPRLKLDFLKEMKKSAYEYKLPKTG